MNRKERISVELNDPIAAYNAASNIEALQVADYLTSEGIDAHATQDDSLVGYWLGGRMPEIHKPQVWVSRSDAEAAARLLAEFESQQKTANPKARPVTESDVNLSRETIEAVCEDCGEKSSFPAKLNGTVQRCPKCWGHMDVGELDWGDFDFGEPE